MVLSVPSVHSVLTNRRHTGAIHFYITCANTRLMDIHVPCSRARVFRCAWCALRLCLWLSCSHVETPNGVTTANPGTPREFVFAWTAMHSEQVCTGNQDWSSRYAALLSPELWKRWFMCASRVCRGNEKCQKSEGLSQFASLTDLHRTEETEHLWKKCLTYIKTCMPSVNAAHHCLWWFCIL